MCVRLRHTNTPQGAPVRRLLRMLLQAAAAGEPATPAAPGPKDGPGPKSGPGPATGLKDGPGPASGPGPKAGPGPAAKPTTPAADEPAEPEAEAEAEPAAAADEDTPATVATVSEEPAEKNVTEKVVSMDAAATVEELTGPKAMIEVSTKPTGVW